MTCFKKFDNFYLRTHSLTSVTPVGSVTKFVLSKAGGVVHFSVFSLVEDPWEMHFWSEN